MSDSDKLQIFIDDAAASQPINDNSGSLTVDGTVTASNTAGDIASGSADSGNPVKVGGKYNSTLPTLSDGQRGDMQVGSRGALRVALMQDGSTNSAVFDVDNADGSAASATQRNLKVQSRNTVFNGSTWDRMRGDSTDGVLVNLGANNDVSLNAGSNAIGKLSANSGVDIGDVDVTTVVPGTGATNLGKAEDAAHTTGDTGVMTLAVRNDSGSALAGTDGDYIPLSTDSAGALRVTGGGGGTEYTEDAAAASDPAGGMSMAVRADSLAAVTSTDGDNIALRATNKGELYVKQTDAVPITDNGGNLSIDDGGNSITVDGTVAVTDGLNIEGDVAHDGVDSGNPVKVGGKARVGTPANVADADRVDAWFTNRGAFVVDGGRLHDETDIGGPIKIGGKASSSAPSAVAASDRVDAYFDTSGRLAVFTDVALPAGTNAIGKLAANSGVDIGDVDVTSVIPGTGATNLGKAEDAGHTSADVGVFNLGVRNDTPNTALTNADSDYAALTTDRVGGIRMALYETDFAVLGTNHVKKYYTNAGAVTDGIVWSPAAGKRWYVTDIFINVSAAATVTLEDDKAGGDEAVWKAELAANSGWSHHFGTPLFSGEDAADLLVTTSAGNVYITVTGYEI